LLRHNTSMTNNDFESDHDVRAKYYTEIVKLLKQTLGATKVVLFEHTAGLKRNTHSRNA
jgi:hypothetical protein